MATQLKYPVYIELYSKTSSFLGSMDKALGAILGLSKGYNDLVKKAKDFERAGKLGAAGSSQLKAVETSALAARKAIVGLAAGFALFKVGEMALKQTVTDLKEAAKFQTQIHNLQGLGEAPGQVAGAKRFAERTAFTLPGAGPTSTMRMLTESRTYTGSIKESEELFPLMQRAAFVWASRTGGDLAQGRSFSESLVRGAEPLMRSSQYGTAAYRKRLSKIMTLEEKGSVLTGIDYAPLLGHLARHSGGTATLWSMPFIKSLMGLIRVSGNRVGAIAPALSQFARFGAGHIPSKMAPMLYKMGLINMGKHSYEQALALGQPLVVKGNKEALTNSVAWMRHIFLPAVHKEMAKEGFNPKSTRATTAFLQHMGFQHNIAMLMSIVTARSAQMNNFVKKLGQVPNLTKQAAIAQATLNGQLLIFHSRLKSLETVLGMPIIHLATQYLANFTGLLTKLGKYLSAHSELAKGLAMLLAVFGPLGIIGGLGLVVYEFARLPGLLKNLSANLDALSTTIEGLSETAETATGAQDALAGSEAAAGTASGAASLSFGTFAKTLAAGYIGWTIGKYVVNPLINWVTDKLTGHKSLGGALAHALHPTSQAYNARKEGPSFIRKDFNPFALTTASGHFRHYTNMAGGIEAMGATLLRGPNTIKGIAAQFSKNSMVPLGSAEKALSSTLGVGLNKKLNLQNPGVLDKLLIALLRESGTAKYTSTTEVGQAVHEVEGMTPTERSAIIHVHGDVNVKANDAKQLVANIRKHLAGVTTAGGGPTARVLTGGH